MPKKRKGAATEQAAREAQTPGQAERERLSGFRYYRPEPTGELGRRGVPGQGVVPEGIDLESRGIAFGQGPAEQRRLQIIEAITGIRPELQPGLHSRSIEELTEIYRRLLEGPIE